MCGIYGSTKLYSDETVRHKLDLMKFRGPDHQEFQRVKKINGEEVTLGHVRLSIMDLDPRSNQPFRYNDNITIVFNGEIYNFEELKHQYLKDVSFRTSSDTEVICAMYEKFGKDCVRYFNGMFAYVIFDKKNNILTGARDRLGKKPFYYYLTNESFEFASQILPLSYQNDFTISSFSRQLYLVYGYITDPYCIYEEVKKLRAGEMFTLDLDSYRIEIEKYWDIFSNSCNFTAPKSYEEAREQVRELLFDAVKIRLRADVPVGMFLSGGIDSSLISAIVSKFNKNITAYTIGFNDSKYNESNHASAVAEALCIPIKINYCEGTDMLDVFNKITKYYDEPFADNSLIPTSLLAQVTRKDVTVALGGDGGDELFFGYNSYMKLVQKEMVYKYTPYGIRKTLYRTVSPWTDNHLIELLQYRNIADAHARRNSYGNLCKVLNFDIDELYRNIPDLDYVNNSDRGYLSLSDYDMKVYMNSCINTKTDRSSMRSSLELRSPIMDYRLAEYSRLIPYEYLYTPQIGGKRILKDILYEMVPREILERPKTGFAAPVGGWFQNELKNVYIKTINKNGLTTIVPELSLSKFRNMINHFQSNARDSDGIALFKVYMYLLWYLSSKY